LALEKNAVQSSSNGGKASRAVDGNRDGVWSGGSCTHCGYSKFNINEWWQVDLGTSVQVAEVTVFNRYHPIYGLRLWNTLFELSIGRRYKLNNNVDLRLILILRSNNLYLYLCNKSFHHIELTFWRSFLFRCV
jgi:hypothetical protein